MPRTAAQTRLVRTTSSPHPRRRPRGSSRTAGCVVRWSLSEATRSLLRIPRRYSMTPHNVFSLNCRKRQALHLPHLRGICSPEGAHRTGLYPAARGVSPHGSLAHTARARSGGTLDKPAALRACRVQFASSLAGTPAGMGSGSVCLSRVGVLVRATDTACTGIATGERLASGERTGHARLATAAHGSRRGRAAAALARCRARLLLGSDRAL